MKETKSKKIKRTYHPYWDWECYKNGFYKTTCDYSEDEAKELYRMFLTDLKVFGEAIDKVFSLWTNSCEHFLTNESINRIAWIGQASACIELGLPSKYRGGFKLLSEEQQALADGLADKKLKEWIDEYQTKNS